MDRITQPKLFFYILTILGVIPFFIHLHKIEMVDNVDYFTLENGIDVRCYNEFKETFGSDDIQLICTVYKLGCFKFSYYDNSGYWRCFNSPFSGTLFI